MPPTSSSAATATEPQWPPRSPHEALLSTPGGRERLRRMAERQSVSPSPVKRGRTPRGNATLGSRSAALLEDSLSAMDVDDEGGNDDDDDEDEETLQLKLQEIQAKLRLKKLQAARTRKKQETGGGDTSGSDLQSRPQSAALLGRRAGASRPAEPSRRSQSQNEIEVPASPVRRAQPPEQQTLLQKSPSRVLLGIDKGWTGKDVSLKRAPSRGRGREQAGGYLQRGSAKTGAADPAAAAEEKRPLSFNERLASARTEEIDRKDRLERIKKLRSSAFTVGKEEVEEYKRAAVDIPDLPAKPPTYTREEILARATKTTAPSGSGYLRRSNTAPSIRSGEGGIERREKHDQEDASQQSSSSRSLGAEGGAEGAGVSVGTASDPEASSFEPYSAFHLSKRVLPHTVVSRAVSGKKTYMLQDLLRDVKAPDWSLPDVEADVVVFAIVASKSDPRAHKPALDSNGNPKPQPDRGKYMVVTLTDLTYSVELFLFKSGFDRFWKLSTGTVVAILNPTIMPPPPGREDTGRWGLVINSDADTILEIGTARDLGYCKSVRRDGQLCNTWINARRTEHCEFHTNEAVRRMRVSRNEVNMASFGSGSSGSGGGGRGSERFRKGAREPEEDRGRGFFDRETQSRWFISQAQGTLSDLDREGGLANKAERQEGLKRRLATKERENDIARKLSELGSGAGKDYMRIAAEERAASRASRTAQTDGAGGAGELGSSGSSAALSSSQTMPQLPTAKSLGLLPKKGMEIRLSPIKRKRPESSLSSSTAGSSSVAAQSRTGGGLGWGSALKDRLTRMKEASASQRTSTTTTAASSSTMPTTSFSATAATTAAGEEAATPARGDRSPVRKKTRFVTEKGIREAGRDSLGGAELLLTAAAKMQRRVVLDDDDDGDELVIV